MANAVNILHNTEISTWRPLTHNNPHRYFIKQNQIKRKLWEPNALTHRGRVTHIRVSKLPIIGSDNGLSPDRHQAIIWTNARLLLIWTLGTNFSEISSEIHTFSFQKMHLKRSCMKWRPFRFGLNVLRQCDLTRKRQYNFQSKLQPYDSVNKCRSIDIPFGQIDVRTDWIQSERVINGSDLLGFSSNKQKDCERLQNRQWPKYFYLLNFIWALHGHMAR